MVVNSENKKRSKGWWDTANRIMGRKTQGIPVSSVLSPEDINVYFQSINTDQRYVTPQPIQIPKGCRVPTVDEVPTLVRVFLCPYVGPFP